jgi:ribose 5-phosphate isomerase|tara:strand:+ start:799 stop:1107 length:309 start_codon:yes stop_codon:yes gene_type:complete
MAIIRYTLVDGQHPSGLSVKNQWRNPVDGTFIGIGSGVGTELSIDELKTHAKSLKSIFNMRYQEWDNEVQALASPIPTVDRAATDAEIESDVDNWCREMGIS